MYLNTLTWVDVSEYCIQYVEVLKEVNRQLKKQEGENIRHDVGYTNPPSQDPTVNPLANHQVH